MVKVGIVSLSQMAEHNRWDVGFHLALNEVKGRMQELRASVTEEDAISRLDRLPVRSKSSLMVLARGGDPRPSTTALRRVAREYPHLALALMERDLKPAANSIRQEIARHQDALQALLAITEPSAGLKPEPREAVAAPAANGFTAGWIYELKDPSRYNDEAGEGYGCVAIARDAEPGTCWSHDAWIVNARGEVHPGYDSNPVPVRLEDVDLASGRPLDGDLPEPRDVFGGPWGGGR